LGVISDCLSVRSDRCSRFQSRLTYFDPRSRAAEESLGERRGGDTSAGEQRNRQNFGECKGKRSDEIAAQKAGFGNKETYRQAGIKSRAVDCG